MKNKLLEELLIKKGCFVRLFKLRTSTDVLYFKNEKTAEAANTLKCAGAGEITVVPVLKGDVADDCGYEIDFSNGFIINND